MHNKLLVISHEVSILLNPILVKPEWLKKHRISENARNLFLEPLILATLNLPSDQGSALLLASVLNKLFAGRRRDALPMLPRATLHDLFVAPAVAAVESNGGQVLCRAAVVDLEPEDKRVAIAFKNGEHVRFDADLIVLAVPAWRFSKLAKAHVELRDTADRAAELSSSPIVDVSLWFDRPIMPYRFAGLLGSPLQWIFSHPSEPNRSTGENRYRVSAVISHAKSEIGCRNDELARRARTEIERFFPAAKEARQVDQLVIKARRATISARPGQKGLRPGPRTAFGNLFLAGDWTDTDLPATIESAIASGSTVARAVTEAAG